MKLITDTIKGFFKNKKNNTSENKKYVKENLTKEQRKKYTKQFLKTSFYTISITGIFAYGMIDLIYQTFQTKNITYLMLFVIAGRIFIEIIIYYLEETRLIKERIYRRIEKNQKQKTKQEE